MDSESPVMRKYPIENILTDATGMLRKNGNRKVILMLDKHFMSYSSQNMSSLNIQLSRRLMLAAQNLIHQYTHGENLTKVDLLLDRCNLYMAVVYINIQRLLKNERGGESFEELTTQQIEQKIGLNRLRQRIRQTICIPGSLIKVTHLNKLKDKHKIKFYINECWVLMLNQMILYARLFKITNEVPNSLKVMQKIEQIIQTREMRNTKNIALLKSFIHYYCDSGQICFQLCEFKQSLKYYDIAIHYLHQLIFMILKKNNVPNVIDDNDLKPIEPYLMQIIMILYLQSLCYEYLSNYSKMKEAIHLSQWICSDIMRFEDEHQLRILIYSRAQDIQRYNETIFAECEIRHLIFTFLAEDGDEEMKSISQNAREDYLKMLNEKFYLKFQSEHLNKQQYIKFQLPIKQTQPIQLYNVPKGSKTERDLQIHQSKNYQSFTTQDGIDSHSKKLITSESESKLIKHNSLSSFSRKTRPTDFTSYCRTEQSDYPRLDSELAGVIVNQLKKEQPFYALQDIEKTCKDELNENERQQQDCELGKAILMFRRQFSKNVISEPKETDSLRQLNNEIKTEFQLMSGYLEAQERLKKKRQQQKLIEQSLKPKDKPKSPFRKMLIKHSNTLGLKQMKKKLQNLEQESALMKLYQKISDKKESIQVQEDHDLIKRKMIQTNLNAIKVIMDENQREQENAQKQLRQRRHVSQQTPKRTETSPKSGQFKDSFKNLANSTQYLSTKGQASKNVISLVELANIKRKLNQMESKKVIRYSELFRKLLKDSGIPKHLLYQSKIDVEHLLCPLCQNILWKPIACGQDKCFQSFCEVCINRWLHEQNGDAILQESLYSQSLIVAPNSGSGSQYSSQSSSFSEMPQQIVENQPNCPNCKRPFKKTSIPIIHNLLDSIQFSCIYQDCNTKPEYEQFQKHIMQCSYRRMNCSGCGLLCLQSELQLHENQCQFVNVQCQKCQISMSRSNLINHTIDDCVQQQFNNKDQELEKLYKKIEQLNQRNSQLEQKIDKMVKGEQFEILQQFSFKTMFTQNYQFQGNQAIEAKLIRSSFNMQKQKNDFLHFYVNHKIKTQSVQGVIWRMRIQTLQGNLLIGICSTLCHYSIDFIINKSGEMKRKEWNENKYKLLRKGNFTFSEGDTLTFQFMPLSQCLRITNENRHIICRFEPTEIIEMGDSFFSFYSLETQNDSLLFI